jgi:hypothetical protein
MEGVREILEIGFGTEFRVELGRVCSPVSLLLAHHHISLYERWVTHMIGLAPSKRSFDIGTNRRYPNGIKPHSLDIIEFIDNTPPTTTAVPPNALITSSITTIR